jgi:transcriptional regulator of acetoin/glycerol metabolism
LKDIEKNAILNALRRNNGKKLLTARELGINKNTLRRKIVGYGIEGKV